MGIRIAFRGRSKETLGALLATIIAATFLSLASGLPTVVTGAAERAEQRAPHSIFSEEGQHQQVNVVRELRLLGDKQVVINFVSPPERTGDPVDPPPGIPQLPTPREAYVSPELDKFLGNSVNDELFSGRKKGIIDDTGLRSPNELFAWVGVTPEEIHNLGVAASGTFGSSPYRANGFGPIPGMQEDQYQISRDPDLDHTTKVLLLVCAIVAAVPCLISAATASQLLSRKRARSLGHLVAAGISHRTARRVAAAEVATVVALGWTIGLLIAPFAALLLRVLVPEHVTWFPEELSVHNWPVIVIAILLTVFCFLTALRERHNFRQKPRSACSAVWWFVGLVLMVGAAAARDHLVEVLNGLPLYLGILGLVCSALFFRAAVQNITRFLGSVLKTVGKAGLLGGARLVQESKEASRGPAAIGLAVLAASLTALITSQLVIYLSGEGSGLVEHDTAAVIETNRAADVESEVSGYTVTYAHNELHGQCDALKHIFETQCSPGQEVAPQVEPLSIIGQLTAGGRVVHGLEEGEVPPDGPESAELVVVPDAPEDLTERVLEKDPFATVQTSQTMKGARMYAADQVVDLFRIAAWCTVLVAAVFVVVAALVSASQRQRLQAVLSAMGTSVGAQRAAWMVFTLIPLVAALILGVLTAVVADVAFLHLLEMPAAPGEIGQAVSFGAVVMLLLGAVYTGIVSRAVSSKVNTTALRSE